MSQCIFPRVKNIVAFSFCPSPSKGIKFNLQNENITKYRNTSKHFLQFPAYLQYEHLNTEADIVNAVILYQINVQWVTFQSAFLILE